MLVLSRVQDQQVVIEVGGEVITVTVVDIDRGKIRLGFQAHQRVKIWRKELIDSGRVQEVKRNTGRALAGPMGDSLATPPGT